MKTRLDRTGLALALGALALRLASWRAVFAPSGTLFVDVDDWNHLRRMLVAARNFPFVPALDRHFAHPDGFLTNWPPMHDWLAAIPIKAAWLFAPGLETAARVAAFIPALYGAATVLLLYRLAKKIMPEKLALIAGIFAAVLPSPLFYSVLGRPDHHCAETFWFLAAVNMLLDENFVWAGSLLACGWLSWSGFAAFQVIVFLWLAWERPKRGSWAFLSQIPLLLLFTAGNPFVRSLNFDFDLPGLFAPSACLVMAAALESIRRKSSTWGACSFVAGAGLAWLVLPSLGRFFSALPRVMYLFTELQPILKPYGRWDVLAVLPWLGWVPFILPVLVWDFVQRRSSPGARLVLIWALAFSVLTLSQTRYVMHLSFVAAIILASSLDRFKRVGVSLAVSIVLLLPALKNSFAMPFVPSSQLTGNPEMREAMEWLRTNTPPTRSSYADEGVPEYGVFVDPNLAPMVAALAERPAAGANNHAMREAMNWTIQLFLRDGAEEVRGPLKAKGFKYVVLDSMNDGGRYYTYLGLTAVPQDKWGWKRDRLALYRLYNGKPDADLKKAFRQVHQSPSGAYKIFEIRD